MKHIWHKLKTLAPSLIAYWLLTAYGVFTFSAVLFLLFPGPELLLVILQLVAVTVVGQLAGHVLAFLRPRLWVVLILLGSSCFVQTLLTAAIVSVPQLALAWFLAPFAVGSGFLAIRSRTEIFGAWMPVMYSVGACLLLVNSSGEKLAAWEAGAKYAIWDVATVGILAGALLLFLSYLVARQSQSLSLWQEAAQAPPDPARAHQKLPENYKPRARVSWPTWILVAGLAFVLTIGTALAAPYLFRTGPPEDKGGKQSGQRDPKPDKQEPREPKQKKPSDMKPPDVDWDKIQEGVQKAAKQGANLLMLLLIFLVGVLLIYFVFWRPLRRVAVLRHLERPAWPVPATERIQNLWRRATIALADLEIQVKEADTADGLALRASRELEERYGKPPAGLHEVASIYSRVQYSIGVTAEDQSRMAAAVELLTEYTEDKQTWWQQVKNLYRGT